MKVGILTPYDPSDVLGGVETFVLTMQKGLKEKGIESELIYPTTKIPKTMQLLTALSLRGRIKRIAKDFDVIHSNKWISWLNASHKTPSIATTHDVIYGWLNAVGDYLPFYHRFYRKHITEWLEGNGYRNTDIVAAISKRTKKEVMEGYGIEAKKIKVVHNGINLDFVVPKRKISKDEMKKDLGIKGDVLLFVGRADIPTKGFDMLMEICKKLRQEKDFTLLMAGSVDRIKNFKKPSWMTLIRLPKNEMWKAYGAADIFLQTSRYEACSLVLLEAFVNDLPIVSFDTGAAPEIVKDGKTGFVIPSFEIGKYIKKTSKLLDSKSLRNRISKNELKEKKKYNSETMVKNYIKLYDKLI